MSRVYKSGLPAHVAEQPVKPLTPAGKARRGFAVMDPQRVREIASSGGVAAHRYGNAHKWTSEEARAAAKKRHEKKVTE